MNPRSAEVCSQCGSRELSTPQPKASFGKQTLLLILRLLPSVAVMAFTIGFFFLVVYAFLIDPQLQRAVVALGIVLVVLWLAYLQLPPPLRNVVRKAVGRPKKGGHH